MQKNHSDIMKRCLELAANGKYLTAPNPMVGAALVYNGKIVSEGWHRKYGAAHAEKDAIDNLSDKSILPDCTLYVNLEPCSHRGKTPPCANLIIQSKIKKVVAACRDSNLKVAGKGFEKLRQNGIEVTEDVLTKEARFLNRRFFTFHEQKRPYIILKWAETADGFIADSKHNSKWISCEESRKLVHLWRCEEQAILIGTNTARIDNPYLTARPENMSADSYRQPLRVVIDRNLTLTNDFNLLNKDAETLVINNLKDEKKENVEYLKADFSVPLIPQVIEILYAKSISSLIVEGGSIVLNGFINNHTFDEMRVFKSEKSYGSGIAAPEINKNLSESLKIDNDKLNFYINHKFI